MKILRGLVFGMCAMFCGSAFSSGPYDGIYEATINDQPVGFASVHENNGQLIVAILQGNHYWGGMIGQRQDNLANLVSIQGYYGVHLEFNVNFPDQGHFAATLTTCYPVVAGDSCLYSPGAIMSGTRIF